MCPLKTSFCNLSQSTTLRYTWYRLYEYGQRRFSLFDGLVDWRACLYGLRGNCLQRDELVRVAELVVDYNSDLRAEQRFRHSCRGSGLDHLSRYSRRQFGPLDSYAREAYKS